MIESDAEVERVVPRQPAPPLVERRSTVRTRLRDVGGSRSWRGDAGDVAVLNISGGGPASLAEDAPQAGRALRLSLRCDPARMEPVEGRVVETTLDPSGKRLVHVRCARWVPRDPLLDIRLDDGHWD
jgi:hypothetical protein